MLRTTKQVVSTFRSAMKVEELALINMVTGTEFPVSGDAPLRQARETLAPATALNRITGTK